MSLPCRIRTKRIDAGPATGDGIRVLVDRLPHDGLCKENYALDACLSELAPSQELAALSQRHPQSWQTYRKLYLKGLRRPEAACALSELYQWASRGKRLTLLFGGEDSRYNNAIILRELLDGLRKPPTGTGPLRPVRVRQMKTLQR